MVRAATRLLARERVAFDVRARFAGDSTASMSTSASLEASSGAGGVSTGVAIRSAFACRVMTSSAVVDCRSGDSFVVARRADLRVGATEVVAFAARVLVARVGVPRSTALPLSAAAGADAACSLLAARAAARVVLGAGLARRALSSGGEDATIAFLWRSSRAASERSPCQSSGTQ